MSLTVVPHSSVDLASFTRPGRMTLNMAQWQPRLSLRASCLSILIGTILSGFWYGHAAIQAEQEFYANMQQIAVVAPDTTPIPSQESVDLAMALFGVSSMTEVTYDPALTDRGLTTRGIWSTQTRVTVGPSSFSSWALLGSTLVHEVEVHCAQNFMMIYVMDLFGFEGTVEAERQAYLYELKQAPRLGLAAPDRQLIADTMDYFYPVDRAKSQPQKLSLVVRRWLARNLK